MSNKFLHQYCESAIVILNSQFNAAQVLRHNGTIGLIREQIIKDFLAAHLPELISVRSGQIVDSNDCYSKQQDVVLVLKGVPRLPFASGNDLIFQEGVVATIEVKTRLFAAELGDIGENIKSVRELAANILAVGQLGVSHNWPHDRILTAIVCYGGMSFDGLLPALNALDEEAKPDLVLDLSKGLVVRNHGLLWPLQPDPCTHIIFQAPAEGFKVFITILAEITGTMSSRGVAWRSYW